MILKTKQKEKSVMSSFMNMREAVNTSTPHSRSISSIYANTERMYSYHSQGVRAPTSTGESCVQLRQVVTSELAHKALRDLKCISSYDNKTNRDRFTACKKLWHEITFNQAHEPVDFNSFSEHSDAVNDLVNVALKRFGHELKLEGKQLISALFLRYNIPASGIKTQGWHTDNCTSWTMLTMLTDSEDPVKGWVGGNLDRSTYFSTKDMDFCLPECSLRTYNHHTYGSILFHNLGTFHRVTEMKPINKEGERTILQLGLSDDKNDKYFGSISNYIPTEEQEPMVVKTLGSDEVIF